MRKMPTQGCTGIRHRHFPYRIGNSNLMPGITAILHTHNDALRIARAVESLRPCDEVLVIDHASSDDTRAMARRFGARVIESDDETRDTDAYLQHAMHEWIFAMLPSESLSEGLEASLLEWKLATHPTFATFGVQIVENIPLALETRLVHATNTSWDGWKPLATLGSVLEGNLLRMESP